MEEEEELGTSPDADVALLSAAAALLQALTAAAEANADDFDEVTPLPAPPSSTGLVVMVI